MTLENEGLLRRIQDYCLRIKDHRRCKKDIHQVTLSSIKEYKEKQQQQKSQKERDEIYAKMSQNLKRVREIVGGTLSRASTISVEEQQLALTEANFITIKEKMNKIDQRLDGLDQNWQAEYREAITPEQCEEIQQFYEPYVTKHETKYKILYKILEQASWQQNTVLFPKEPSLGMTPSLAVLDDASALKQKEWNRSGPNEEMLYSTIGRHLTLTAPAYDDVRADSTLNVVPEGSIGDLPAAVEGIEERESMQQIFGKGRNSHSNIVPPNYRNPGN